MNHSRYTLIGAGFVAFVLAVLAIESHSRRAALERMSQHARAVAPALWHVDPRLAADYLRLAAESSSYESIEIRDDANRVFLAVQGPALSAPAAFLDRLNLFPRVELTAAIVHNGDALGLLHARWISRNLYPEIYVLLALTLIVVLAERSLRVVEGKRTLEQRVAERTRQLAERESGLRQLTRLLDLSPDVVFVRESDGPVRYWNESAARFAGGATPDGIAGRLKGFFDAMVSGESSAALASRGTWSGETEAADGAGRSRRFHVSISLTPGEPGDRPRVLVIATDVTLRKELEAHLLRAQRAQAAGTLASGVAHDFNNLLTPILLSAQILRHDAALPASARSTLDTVEQCAKRGAELVRQLLNLSGNRPAHRRAVQLADLLHDIAALLQGTFPKAIAIATDWPAHLPLIEADATNLHQAILNLCVNARDAMPDGGRLRLSARPVRLTAAQQARRPEASASEWVAVAVADTGCGIAPDVQERIFEPFFTTKAAGQGTGLGLATVHAIAHSHGGFVELESALDRGSTFTLYLPVPPGVSAGDAIASSAPTPRGAGETILLVDDEPAVLAATTRQLEHSGFRVLPASSGAEALRVFAAHRDEIRGVLTDLMMPGMDGIALARALHQEAPALPVAVMTGLLHQANRDAIAAANFRTILAKPYRADELLACMQRLLAAR